METTQELNQIPRLKPDSSSPCSSGSKWEHLQLLSRCSALPFPEVTCTCSFRTGGTIYISADSAHSVLACTEQKNIRLFEEAGPRMPPGWGIC